MVIEEGLELLTEGQCRELLRAQQLGRVGVSVGALPAIFPVNYCVLDGDIFFRAGEGTKLRRAVEDGVVGFEVDHVDADTKDGWSVLVIGMARVLSDLELDALGPIDVEPWAGPGRTRVVRIRPELISGRRIVRTPN